MAIRPILTVPDPVLKQVSKRVDAVTDATRALMDDMLETMYAAPGIGLAAVQIGEPVRVIEIAPGMVRTEEFSLKRLGWAEAADSVYRGVRQPLVWY